MRIANFPIPAETPDLRDIRLDGPVGARLRDCFTNHVARTDGVALAEHFRWRTERFLWQTEFWGKWMHSAVPLARMFGDERLLSAIDASVAAVCAAQLPDGYIGNFREESRCGGGWDVWGMKYTMLGLLLYSEWKMENAKWRTDGEAALSAASRLCGYLESVFGPGRRDIAASGMFRGLASCSVLEAVVRLWRRTGDERHLDFARTIVEQMDEHPGGPRLIRDAGVPVAARSPEAIGSYGPGAPNPALKAYEMMSCCQGLLEYGEATGDRRFLDAVVKTAESIAETEITLCGGASCAEHWYSGALRQHRPFAKLQETCVTTTWMRLCGTLLALTGESRWADELEKSFHNAYLGALKPDGSAFASYSPIAGFRSYGQHHCNMHTNCCNANGPRGFVAFLESCLLARGRDVFLNLYASGRFSINVPGCGEKATFQIFTLYPERGRVELWYRGETPLDFTLHLRTPAWSEKTAVLINGEPVGSSRQGGASCCSPLAVRPGTYLLLSRTWTMGDSVSLDFDMSVRAHELDGHVAFTSGPLTLARDMRFGDGDIGEVVRADRCGGGLVPSGAVPGALQVRVLTDAMRANWALPLPMGAHRESPEKALPDIVRFCDYASAGNTWDSASSYRVWLPLECLEPERPQ